MEDPNGDGQVVYLFLPLYKVCAALRLPLPDT